MKARLDRYPHYIRNLLVSTALAILGGALVFGVAITIMQTNAFLAPRPSQPEETPLDFGLSYEDVRLTSSDGVNLSAWFVSAPQPNGAGLVLVHGHGGNRSALLANAEILAKHGYSTLLLDLRGHGQSEGDLVTYGYLESQDVLAGVEFLVQRPEIQPIKIGLLGQSLGGAAVIHAGSQSDIPRVLIIESTFHSLPAAIEDAFDDMSVLPPSIFAPLVVGLAESKVGVQVDELDLAADLALFAPRACLLIHGEVDDLLPLDHHVILRDAAREPKVAWVIPGMGHESAALFVPEEYERRVINYLDQFLLVQDE
jgi:alpha-beta hydrolase superfamily lysophospholipase